MIKIGCKGTHFPLHPQSIFIMIFFLFVIINPNEVARLAEGIPRDVEPARAGEQLVGVLTGLEEGDEALELGGVLGADVDGLSKKVLGIGDATDKGVDTGVAEA